MEEAILISKLCILELVQGRALEMHRKCRDLKLKRLEEQGTLIGLRALQAKVPLPKLNPMFVLDSKNLKQMTLSSRDLKPNLFQIELKLILTP